MHHWIKRLFAIAAPLLLTACLWGPGKFTSDLTVKKDGSFVLDYRGEMVLQLPDDGDTGPWTDAKAKCEDAAGKTHPCTKDEIAGQKTAYEKKRQDAEQAAKLFGLPGIDDDSNRAFAAKLMKYAGWRSVVYRGKGVFDVDYHFAGRATQDFLFPALPDNDLLVPFIAIRRRADGSVLVTAPAFTGGAGPLAARAGEAAKGEMKPNVISHAQGRFTVITDGEILTNNSEDGAAPTAIGRQVHWDVSPASTKIPETLIRL
jgi:hypothetical protein